MTNAGQFVNVFTNPTTSHLHAQLPKCKTAESSFTTGTPMIDIKAILKILEEKEADYTAKEKAAP